MRVPLVAKVLAVGERVEDRVARVLLGPDAGEAPGAAEDARIGLVRDREQLAGRRSEAAHELLLGDGARVPEMRVGAPDEADLVRVDADPLRLAQPLDQRVARVVEARHAAASALRSLPVPSRQSSSGSPGMSRIFSKSQSSSVPPTTPYMPLRHSDSPLCCTISTIGSRPARRRACSRCSSSGRSRYQIAKSCPFDRFGLCGIASASQPESVSTHWARSLRQNSGSLGVSIHEIGSSGTISLRKITLRWTLVNAGERLYS